MFLACLLSTLKIYWNPLRVFFCIEMHFQRAYPGCIGQSELFKNEEKYCENGMRLLGLNPLILDSKYSETISKHPSFDGELNSFLIFDKNYDLSYFFILIDCDIHFDRTKPFKSSLKVMK